MNKPYLVQPLAWVDGVHGPRPGSSPMFISAPSPKAAAVRAARWRSVHDGKDGLRVRVTTIKPDCQLENSGTRDYYVHLEVRVSGAEPV